jgi:hypothetical protein
MGSGKKFYKVLNSDMLSPSFKFKYKLGKEYHCDNFDSNKNVDCTYGFYATEFEGIPFHFSEIKRRRVFECDVRGKEVRFDLYKHRHEYIRLTREIPYDELKEMAEKEEERLGYKLSEVLFPAFLHPSSPVKRGFMLKRSDIDLAKKWLQLYLIISSNCKNYLDSCNNKGSYFLCNGIIETTIKDLIKTAEYNRFSCVIKNSVYNPGDYIITNRGDSASTQIDRFAIIYTASLDPVVSKLPLLTNEHTEDGKNIFDLTKELMDKGLFVIKKLLHTHGTPIASDKPIFYQVDWYTIKRLHKIL